MTRIAHLKPGQKVWVQELQQIGPTQPGSRLLQNGEWTYAKRIEVQGPKGPITIDHVERAYTLITGLAAILKLVLQLLRSF